MKNCLSLAFSYNNTWFNVGGFNVTVLGEFNAVLPDNYLALFSINYATKSDLNEKAENINLTGNLELISNLIKDKDINNETLIEIENILDRSAYNRTSQDNFYSLAPPWQVPNRDVQDISILGLVCLILITYILLYISLYKTGSKKYL